MEGAFGYEAVGGLMVLERDLVWDVVEGLLQGNVGLDTWKEREREEGLTLSFKSWTKILLFFSIRAVTGEVGCMLL